MELIERIIFILDRMLDTRRKRHVTGGLLLSASLLFGGIAVTVMTIKDEAKIIIDQTEETKL